MNWYRTIKASTVNTKCPSCGAIITANANENQHQQTQPQLPQFLKENPQTPYRRLTKCQACGQNMILHIQGVGDGAQVLDIKKIDEDLIPIAADHLPKVKSVADSK